jgi:hypothetical protein
MHFIGGGSRRWPRGGDSETAGPFRLSQSLQPRATATSRRTFCQLSPELIPARSVARASASNNAPDRERGSRAAQTAKRSPRRLWPGRRLSRPNRRTRLSSSAFEVELNIPVYQRYRCQ